MEESEPYLQLKDAGIKANHTRAVYILYTDYVRASL